MELNQVRYFLKMCEMLNFTLAADACSVSQPSLTRGIKRLEDELGGDLFRRERSRTHLTELGRMMQPVLAKCYEGALQAMRTAQEFSSGNRASIRIGMTRAIEVDRVFCALEELFKAIPSIELTIVRDERDSILSGMEYGDLDFAVASGMDGFWERFDTWPLFEDSFSAYFAADGAFGDCDVFELGQIANHSYLAEPFCDYSSIVEKHMRTKGISPQSTHTMTSRCDTMSFLVRDLGVAIIPTKTTKLPGIKVVPIPELDLKYNASIFAVSGRQYSPAGAQFVKIVRQFDDIRKLCCLQENSKL